jgi:hypothetical protein
MSSQSVPSHRSRRPAPAPRDGKSDALWIAAFVLAAEVGGLAAAALTHESTVRALAIPFGVAAIVVGVLWTGALDPRPAARRHRGSAPGGQPAGAAAAQAGPSGRAGSASGGQPMAPADERAPRDGAPARPAGPARNSQPYAWSWPLPAEGADAPVPRPPAPVPAEPRPVGPGVLRVLQDRTGASGPPRTADLAQFLGQVVIAQCPHCAAFRVGADGQAQDWTFSCHECGRRWAWRPGTPWPEVHVRPDDRRRLGRRSS